MKFVYNGKFFHEDSRRFGKINYTRKKLPDF